MIKAITAAAVLSLVMCSTVRAGTVSSVPGLKAAATAEAVQVAGKSGRASHARNGGGRRSYARRGGRGGGGGGYGYGGGWGGPGVCGWVGPVWICP